MKKIIILIFVVFLSLVGTGLCLQEPSPAPPKPSDNQEKHTGKKEQQPPKDHDISKKAPPKIDIDVSPAKPQNDKEDRANQRDNKTLRDWWAIIPTLVIAVFAVIQGLAMILQYRAMREQVKELCESVDATKAMVFTAGNQSHHMAVAAQAAKRSAESLPRIERAYVFVTIDPPKTEPVYDKEGGHEGLFLFCTDIMIWNHGKTPAVINKIHGVISLGSAVEPDELDIPPGLVVGGIRPFTRIPILRRLLENERADIAMKNTMAYCRGWIEYEDIFHDGHITEFCWEYRPSDLRPLEPWVMSSKHKELNHYT